MSRRRIAAPMRSALPPISMAEIEAVADMLQTEQDITKPPINGAAVLALIVKLHQLGKPLPSRDQIADHVARQAGTGSCSRFTVDKAISTRASQGYITGIAYSFEDGHVARGEGIVKRRHVTPSAHLISVMESAAKHRR